MAGRATPKKAAPKKQQSSKKQTPPAAASKAKKPAVATKRTPEAKPKAKAKKTTPASKAKPVTTAPLASPSERLLATVAELPAERALTDEEREAMEKVSETARRFVGAHGAPDEIVERIATFVDEVRGGHHEEPKSQDVRLGLGVLWGEQLRVQAGWRWVHLTYRDGFASYALVPDDRAFACFPLNRVPEALRTNGANTAARLFTSICEGSLPTRKPSAYLVIG